jgi:septal ring factor EnvC (AmiA/AmiB activator)
MSARSEPVFAFHSARPLPRRRFAAAPRPLLIAAAALLLAAIPIHAQDAQRNLRDSQVRLDSIRQERTRLQREYDELQSRVRDVARELQNITRQRTASLSALQELDFQSAMLAEQVEETNASLTATRERLRRRSTEMNVRLRSMYMRGRLHSLRVILGAESFGDLLNRYKYLHMLTAYERSMIAEVGRLERSLRQQEETLRTSQVQLDLLRAEKHSELASLERIEAQQNQTLRQYEQQQSATSVALDRLVRDEAMLADVIGDLEQRRLAGVAAGASATASALHARMLGTLPWPVEGEIIYRFGLERRPNNVVLRQNGVGIAAPLATPVRAVEAGTVTMARSLEGYGPAVMLSHGGGYYTLYLYLRSLSVREGQPIDAGHTLGTVGGEQTPQGPHIEFRVLVPFQNGPPQPVDPLDWLRPRRGS